jgi:hypothetical protein
MRGPIAGWHTAAKALKVPCNVSLMPLPARAPELNPRKTSLDQSPEDWDVLVRSPVLETQPAFQPYWMKQVARSRPGDDERG